MSERPDLNELRGKLDEIDNSILDLLEERMAACRQIGNYKREHGMDVYVPSREEEKFKALEEIAGFESRPYVRELFKTLTDIPKDHQNSITTLDEISANRIIKMAPKIGVALMRTINAEGFNLFLNNGSVAGQTVWHCHMHVLPRFAGDKVVISSEPMKYDSMDQMAELAGKLFNKLNAQ